MNTAAPFPWPKLSPSENSKATFRPGGARNPDHALLVAKHEAKHEAQHDNPFTCATEDQLQNQRWEAVGRLTGGVVHDFNNLLTGVMLCCDLLLSSMDTADRRRRYADEIRAAIVQASGLVRQLLVFARPQSAPARPLLLNEIATAMDDLLKRLIGANIVLDLHLDPELGLVQIDQAQAQQILLTWFSTPAMLCPKAGALRLRPATAISNPWQDQCPNPRFPASCSRLGTTDAA
jgi:signal transduction histidine kinase